MWANHFQKTHLVVSVIIVSGQHSGIVPLVQLGRAPEILVALGGQILLHVGRYAAVPLPQLDGNQIRLAESIRFGLGPGHLVVVNDEIAQL